MKFFASIAAFKRCLSFILMVSVAILYFLYPPEQIYYSLVCLGSLCEKASPLFVTREIMDRITRSASPPILNIVTERIPQISPSEWKQTSGGYLRAYAPNFRSENLSVFTQILSGSDLDLQLQTVDSFHRAMHAAGIPYFLYSGSLLGSWRHHGLVPWDDDVDVAVPRKHRDLIRSVLRGRDLLPAFRLSTVQGIRWKFFSRASTPIDGTPFGWPYIDVSFYVMNDTHVWDADQAYPAFSYPLDDVFPLKPRPFMNRLLPAPFNTEAVLNRTYNLRMCTTGTFDHRHELETTNRLSVECNLLMDTFPFVHRVRSGQGCNETLVQKRSRVVSWFYRGYGTC